MNGYEEYQQLLNSSIQDAQSKGFKAQSKYEGALNAAEQVRSTIDKATEGVGDIFLVKPAQQLLETIKGKSEQAISDFSKQHFSQVSRDVGETLSENDVSPEIEAQQALGQSTQEAAFEEEGTQMTTYFNDNTQLETSFGKNINTTDEDTARMLSQQGREQIGGAELSEEQTASTAGEDTAITGGETTAETGGETALIGGETAEIGADVGLLADPLTFLFGVILGVGTIVGGIEAGKSAVKNPAVPKPPAIANVSTQIGIGSN